MTDYHNKRPPARIGSAGRKSEKRLAKTLNAKLTPASGAAGAKGDMTVTGYLIEAKSTTQASMALRHEWLSKIAHEARMSGNEPALAVSFVTANGMAERDGDWVLITRRQFQELTPWPIP